MRILFPVLRQITMLSSKIGIATQGDDWVEESPDEAFHWNGHVAAGQTLEIIGNNGSIRARGVEGSEVRVVGIKRGDREKIQKVSIEMEQTAEGVRIKTVYPRFFRNDVEVNFAVEVPVGVRIMARMSNGPISIKSVSGSAELVTGNGGITIADSGWVSAETSNGFIRASIREQNWTKPIRFRTANGSISVELPQNTNTRIRAKTMHGSVDASFPLTQVEDKGRNSLIGVVGSDNQRELICECINGSVHLSKAV
jgi:hypothetical protein